MAEGVGAKPVATFEDFRVQREGELRLEVPIDDQLENTITLLPHQNVNAEYFGVPLAPDIPYTLPHGAAVSIYSWSGCTVRLNGSRELMDSVSFPERTCTATRAAIELHCLLQE